MRRLIPTFIIEQFERKRFQGDFQATTIFIDIVGFTGMTQALMENGKEGAELLADIINQVFTPAIDAIYAHNGFVSSFAGDAFTAIFPSDSVDVSQALSAASFLQRLFAEKGEQHTRFGSFDLSVRIGLSYGVVSWGIIQQYVQNSYHFGGEAVICATECEQNAAIGEVVIDEMILSQLQKDSRVVSRPKMKKYHILLSAPTRVDTVCKVDISPSAMSIQKMFVPEEIFVQSGRGEFRDIVSCFISFDEKSLLERGAAKVIAQAHRFGGYFNKIDFSINGGMMLVLFGAPVNPGNLYNRALDFALAVKEIPELTLRIGLTYGTAFVGFIGSELYSEYTALGTVVNLSSRFTQNKKQAVIYLDHAIYRQSLYRYDIRKLKPSTFKGFSGKVPIYRLTGRKTSAQSSIYEGKIIGRDPELKELAKLIEPISNGEFGGIAYVYGSPGVGKSRLAHELIRQTGIRTVILQTDSILRKPLNPFTYFFDHYFQSSRSGSMEQRKAEFRETYQKLVQKTENLADTRIDPSERLRISMELDRVESIIGALVGLFWTGSIYDIIDSQDRAVATEFAIKEFFRAISLIEPVILFIEDLQWIDSASLDAFEILTRCMKNIPLIILACSRFNDDGTRPVLVSDVDVPTYLLTLEELPAVATEELIVDRLEKMVAPDLSAYIQSRTEGNPFYIEQFCLYLRENNVIEVRHEKYHLMKETTNIPADINMILMARIDRLSAELKETVQIASVLGCEFDVQVLTTLVELMQTKTELVFAEMFPLVSVIENQGIWSALTEMRYIFSHALLRDVVYDMQLRARLRELHKLAGDAIAKLNPAEATKFADCAFHYEKACDWDMARKYCAKAGEFFMESVRYDDALEYHEKALSICLDTVGENHLDTATAYNNAGGIYSDMGSYDKAYDYHNRALSIQIELLGEKHLDTATSFDSIGLIHSGKGDYDAALSFYEKALAIRIELLEEKHQLIADSLNNIGVIHSRKSNIDDALSSYERALEIQIVMKKENHPLTAELYNHIGSVYCEKDDYEKALSFQEKALAIKKKLLGEKHPDTARSYNNIGVVYFEMGSIDTALDFYEKALVVKKKMLGVKHPSTAATVSNIGVIYFKQGDYAAALESFEEALLIQKEILGEKHPATASSYNNIGAIRLVNKDYSGAKSYIEKALVIKKELLGHNHPSTASSLTSLASINKSLEKYKKAGVLFRQALDIYISTLGPQHSNTVKCANEFAVMYEAMGNEVKAKQIRNQLDTVNGN